MKNIKKLIALSLAATAVLSTSIISFADSKYDNPIQAAAGLTGKTIEEVSEARKNGQTLAQYVDQFGKLEEFQAEVLEQKREMIQARIEAGRITQEQGDAILKNMEENQENCNLTGGNQLREKPCNQIGKGMKSGLRDGSGQGGKNGFGPRDGSGVNGFCM